ncbi:hypothetical protein PV773_24715 [Mesorhizobium sp. CC13]|uniref:hypothetical protein n=1 Tax=Mesorhizobium sp. CC13 TaxID=3029194 RepID=UPI0032634C78
MPTDRYRASNAGFALVAVVGFLLVASAIVAPFALAAKTRLMIASNNLERERLSLIATGLVNVVASKLGDEKGSAPVAIDNLPKMCRLADLAIELQVQSHDGLIDLNAADVALLDLGLKAIGLPATEASETARSIIAFRTGSRAFSEISDSQAPPLVGGPKHAPFESVSELHDVLPAGIATSQLYEIFTVYSRSGTISRPSASRPIRDELRSSGNAVANAITDKAGIPVYTIAISVKNAPGLMANANYIVGPAFDGRLQFLAPSPPPSALFSETSQVACEQLFGASVASTLSEWRNG